MEDGQRWLIIHGYPVPVGYNVTSCRLAIQIPASYPTAELDMYYCDPALTLISGGTPPAADVKQVIEGVMFQRWSRHRPPGTWSALRDGIATHLALVDVCIEREVGL
ncbi:E2/UBC family protein [Lysobacter gummosus]|uniref:E2/UBC family protein n=1 Tax=Lysobacter gummosus TaxID=262324 RepID=UPI003641C3D8